MPVSEKILCSSCGKIYSQEEFYKGRKDCRSCYINKRKNRYRKNRESILIRQKERYRAKSGDVNIIDLADEFLSLHGIDFLKIVRERRKNNVLRTL